MPHPPEPSAESRTPGAAETPAPEPPAADVAPAAAASAPPAALNSLQARYGTRYRWLLLLSVMVGVMASIGVRTWAPARAPIRCLATRRFTPRERISW